MMKKIICLIASILVGLHSAAIADAIPSKTISDMTKIVITGEHIPENAPLVVKPVMPDDTDYEELLMVLQEEIQKMSTTHLVDYFGEVRDAEGNAVNLTEWFGTEELKTHEICPLVVEHYDETYGPLTVTMYFPTPYEADEQVLVLIGIVTLEENEKQSVEWIAFDGIGLLDAYGAGIKVSLDAGTVLAVQEGMALLAILNK